MKFNRIDENTINCLITQDDLVENGIDLDDLLKRTPKAMDYLRRVILEAAQAENFTITGEFTSMQVRIMKDQSISLTLSQGKRAQEIAAGNPAVNALNAASAALGNGGAARQKAAARTASGSGKAGKGTAGSGNNGKPKPTIYAFTFGTMADAIDCCRKVTDAAKLPSSLYFDNEEGAYYLFLSSPGDDEVKFEKTILAMNEFGTFVEVTPEEVAYIMEHKKCILKENAAAELVKL